MNPRQAEHMVLHGIIGAQIYRILVIMCCISVDEELTAVIRIHSCIGNTANDGKDVPLLVVCLHDRHIVINGFLLM